MFHLYYLNKITNLSFTQENVTNFRKGLFKILSVQNSDDVFSNDPKSCLSVKFVRYFFPYLKEQKMENDEYVYYYMSMFSDESVDNSSTTDYSEEEDTSEYNGSGSISGVDYEGEVDSNIDDDVEDENGNENGDNDEDTPDEDDDDDNNIISYNVGDLVMFRDNIFKEHFYENGPTFSNLDEVTDAIELYQKESNITLKVTKTIFNRGHRVYICKQHEGCKFRAATGFRGTDKSIVFKNCHLKHSGKVLPPFAKDDRKWKKRLNGRLKDSVEQVKRCKNADPLPADVIKATQSFKGKKPSYNEAWRTLKYQKQKEIMDDKRSYELIIPYLEKFVINNPNSVVDYSVDENNCITHCFICHGSMNAKLHHVRPIICIDATFVKEEDDEKNANGHCTLARRYQQTMNYYRLHLHLQEIMKICRDGKCF